MNMRWTLTSLFVTMLISKRMLTLDFAFIFKRPTISYLRPRIRQSIHLTCFACFCLGTVPVWILTLRRFNKNSKTNFPWYKRTDRNRKGRHKMDWDWDSGSPNMESPFIIMVSLEMKLFQILKGYCWCSRNSANPLGCNKNLGKFSGISFLPFPPQLVEC